MRGRLSGRSLRLGVACLERLSQEVLNRGNTIVYRVHAHQTLLLSLHLLLCSLSVHLSDLPTLPLLRFLSSIAQASYTYISVMLITLLLILSTWFAPLTLTASPVGFQDTVHCYNKPGSPPASVSDCTNLLESIDTLPRFRVKTIYLAKKSITFELGSCDLQLRAKDPQSGVFERIRLREYFPALQQIIDQCLETWGQYSCGRIDVGQYFWASLGADRPVGKVGNETFAGGSNGGTGVKGSENEITYLGSYIP